MRKNQFFKMTRANSTAIKLVQVVDFNEKQMTYRETADGAEKKVWLKTVELTATRKPASWGKAPKAEKPAEKSTASVRKPTEKSAPTPIAKGVTKKAQAHKLYSTMVKNGVEPQRTAVVAAFKSKLGLTQNGASTYASICRNAYAAANPVD